MKTFALTLSLLASTTASFASTLPEQDACLESAAATMAASKNAAKQDLDATLEKCRTMPNVDVVNECVNDAFSVFETATRNASKVYKADVQSCL